MASPTSLRSDMDIHEITALAKTHTDALFAEELTRNELVMLLALIQARIYGRIYGTPPPAEPMVHPVIDKVLEPVKPKKPVSYDPVYDPEPPFETDKPPAREASTRVLAEPNHACVCVSCNKVAYTVNRLIRDGDKIDSFIASYTPSPGVPQLNKRLEIMNVDGQISIDCPFCRANKSLYLTGNPVHRG